MPAQPGDFEVVKISGVGGTLISFGQWLNGAAAFTTWDHARVYLGRGLWLEAEPSGARTVRLGERPSLGGLCSAGVASLSLTAAQQAMVWDVGHALEGTPYSGLDYVALAARRLRIPAPHLRKFIADSHRAMCSQLVDLFRLQVGSHLFADGRWPGDVTPWDLGHLLEAAGAQITP